MQSAQRYCAWPAQRVPDKGTAHIVQRNLASFQYASSQPAHSVLCDKLPHSAHRFGNAACITCSHAEYKPRETSAKSAFELPGQEEYVRNSMIGPPTKGYHAEWTEANEYTSCYTTVRLTCPNLRLK